MGSARRLLHAATLVVKCSEAVLRLCRLAIGRFRPEQSRRHAKDTRELCQQPIADARAQPAHGQRRGAA